MKAIIELTNSEIVAFADDLNKFIISFWKKLFFELLEGNLYRDIVNEVTPINAEYVVEDLLKEMV